MGAYHDVVFLNTNDAHIRWSERIRDVEKHMLRFLLLATNASPSHNLRSRRVQLFLKSDCSVLGTTGDALASTAKWLHGSNAHRGSVRLWVVIQGRGE